MSDNLGSQQLSMHGIQVSQLEHISNKLESSLQMGLSKPVINDPAIYQMSVPNNQMGPGSTDSLSQQRSITNKQAQLLESIPNNNFLQKLPMSDMQTGQMDPHTRYLVPPFLLPKRHFGEMEAMLNNGESPEVLMTSKRKVPTESTSNDSLSPKLLLPNKRAAQMEHRPWLQQTSTPQKIPAQMQSVSGSSGSQCLQAPSKRHNPSKSGLQHLSVQKKQTGQMQPSPRVQHELYDSVRSKLRQSLADALGLVSRQQDKPSNAEKNSQVEATSYPGQSLDNSQSGVLTSGTANTIGHDLEKPEEALPIKEDMAQNLHDDQNASQVSGPHGNAGGTIQTLKVDGQQSVSSVVLRDDVSFSDSFFVKDELLQGNGLSWVLEADIDVDEKKDAEAAQKQPNQESVNGGQAALDPKVLASKIEAELFKLFGGVNKKYKEKGRSLLFNLKDCNNPELRERVMTGEIPPERLCSMTAEELASKELSQWRMAKAEELAQMVVLPDDVDIRRLVKKTHKGEFEVEVEQQDNVSFEVAVEPSSITEMPTKLKETEASLPLRPDQTEEKPSKPGPVEETLNSAGGKSNSDDQEVPCTLTIPSAEGADLMQGLMVDDDVKDSDFLPPIVSLDEFMESLDSEPPFENLPVDAETTKPISDKDDSPVDSDSKSSDLNASDPADSTPNKPDNVAMANSKLDVGGKFLDSHRKPEITPSLDEPKGEHVWEGLLQLNISAIASITGIFKSGDKTSTKEWSGFVEIKGRVRLDAFDKFLQDLSMSRSRAVMAAHFICKEGSPESERASLSEVADSYVLDGRVGFAEPAPGVELYLCPPHSKTREMLIKVLPKDQIDELNAIDNGLIGVVVWRKAHVTSISHNTSHHKHKSKKQHFTPRRPHEKDTTNVNVNVISNRPLHGDGPQPDDDDVPPGFGPSAYRDEDDLPEFNFSGGGAMAPRLQFPNQNPSREPGIITINQRSRTPSRPVDQMRELVHRYGQPKIGAPSVNLKDNGAHGFALHSWDDDDDMPEWRPEENNQRGYSNRQPAHLHVLQQPLRAHALEQPIAQKRMAQVGTYPAMTSQPQQNVMHGQQNFAPSWHQGAWIVPPASHDHPAYQTNGVQAYGAPEFGAGQQGIVWRRDVPRSRGF